MAVPSGEIRTLEWLVLLAQSNQAGIPSRGGCPEGEQLIT